MDAETNVEHHGALMRLYHQIKDYESWLLPLDVLQRLGIHASQVDTTDNETLQFNPCFFRPHPEKLLHLYYFGADLDDYQRGLNPVPSFDAILEQARKDFPNGGEYLKIANLKYYSAMKSWAGREGDPDVRARELFDYIDHHLDVEPEDQPEDFTLHSLGDLQDWK